MIEVGCEGVTELFTGFGRPRVRAEKVASLAAAAARKWIAADVPVGPHLADQLLLPMVMAGGGRFRTLAATMHTRTNADVIAAFTDIGLAFEPDGEHGVTVVVGSADRFTRESRPARPAR